MSEAKLGDTVRVHYNGKLVDGSLFDSSRNREPIEFTIGKKHVIPGFEEGVIGMSPGDVEHFKVSSEKAYGPYLKELVLEVDRKFLPENIDPQVGQQLEIRHLDGTISIVSIIGLTEQTLTIDANHPLAGKDLFFEVELVEIIDL